MRESMIFYQSFAKAIKILPEEEQLKALWAVIDYALEGTEPEENGMYKIVYEMAKPQIDANAERKRNGATGGRPTKKEENPTKVTDEKKKDHPPYKEIIEYLNEKAGKRYSVTEKTKTLINARANEGFKLQDFQEVIQKKVTEWKGTEMDKFLRPETLFGTKFEGYLNQSADARKKAKSTGFSNFEERNYDFDDLEKQLLNSQGDRTDECNI